MKKCIKYIFTFVALFLFYTNSVAAVTILETTKDDNYDKIEEGSIIIGVSKFEPDVVLTASRVAKAGANDAAFYAEINNSIDGYEAPVIYVYYGVGGWYELDDDNNAIMITDEGLIDDLSYQKLYYVNNVEKKIEVSLDGLKINEEKLPEGVLLQDDNLLVDATLEEFVVYSTDGEKITYSYAEDVNRYTVNYSVCYQSEDGYITSYSDECVKNVKLPEMLHGKQVIGVKAGAFDNKGIISVEIPSNIMHLEDNAFNNNNLNSVIIKDKYDSKDFTTYGKNVFGNFKEEDIIYDNDLTRLINKFNDENVIKVKTGLSLEKWQLEEVLLHNETKRLNIKEQGNKVVVGEAGDGPRIYEYNSNLYVISLCHDLYCAGEELNDNEEVLIISLPNSDKEVRKKITYEVEEVDVGSELDEKINKLTLEIEKYLSDSIESFLNNNYNAALYDEKEMQEIFDKNGLSAIYHSTGDWPDCEPIKVNDKITIENLVSVYYMLVNDDVVIEDEYGINYNNGIYYNATNIEGNYSNIDEKIDAAIKAFENETKVDNYNIIMNAGKKYDIYYLMRDEDGNAIVRYDVILIDADTSNLWHVIIDEKEEDFIFADTYKVQDAEGNMYEQTLYNYYPNISFEDYDTTAEFKNAAIDKLASKVGVSDFSDYTVSFNLERKNYEPDENGIYEYHYIVHLYPIAGVVDGKITTYNINLNKYLDYKIEINNEPKLYEVTIDPSSYFGEADKYKNDAINIFIKDKNITDYEVESSDGFYIKDPLTGEFERYSGVVSQGMQNIYESQRIIDYAQNQVWVVLYPYLYS